MKKQLAVLMAAATAVTTVAPVLANAEKTVMNDVSVSEVSKKMKEALAMKYETKKEDGINPGFRAKDVEDYVNSRYIVFTDVASNKDEGIVSFEEAKNDYNLVKDATGDADVFGSMFKDYAGKNVVTDADKAMSLIEGAMLRSDASVQVTIVDKGVNNKKSFVVKTNKIYVDAVVDKETEVSIQSDVDELINKHSELLKGKVGVDYKNTDRKFTLKSGTVIEFKVGMEAYDFSKAYAKDGQELDLTVDTNKDAVLEQVVKFGVVANDNDKTKEVDVMNGDVVEYNLRNVLVSKIDVPTVYTEETGYTEAGAELINKIIDAAKGKSNNTFGNTWFNYMGVSYNLVSLDAAEAKIDKVGDMYVLRVDAMVKDNSDSALKARKVQFAFEGKIQKDLARVRADLVAKAGVTVGKFKKLAGMDRFETAIQVSNERFKNGKADSVVIVGANALMDGLSAAPLAAAKNAPVLLADAKMGLNEATLKEIVRTNDSLNRKMVYIVGGMNSVPTSVDKMLSEKYGAVVVRLAGMDRYETSLKVLELLKDNKHVGEKSNLFVVGGEGAADAMSVSSVAAMVDEKAITDNKVAEDMGVSLVDGKMRFVSPVVVVPQKAITKEVRNTVMSLGINNTGEQHVFAIGGENSISTNVLRTLADVGLTPSRIAGADRYATNVKVIKRFYKDVNGLIVTSGETKYLVDAQTSGALAAEKGAPVLLTGSVLTSDQMDLFKKDAILYKISEDKEKKNNVIQVGGVVTGDVMKTIVQKLGL